jgi:predicted transcriptional regulator
MTEMDKEEQPDHERDENTGKFSVKYELDDFLDALRRLDGSASTKEIADEVGCSRRTAHYRLSNLQDENRINSRQVGRSILWEVNDNVE